MPSPQEGQALQKDPTTLNRAEKRLFPIHEAVTQNGEAPLLEQAAESRGFAFSILQTGGEEVVYQNGGAPIKVPEGYVLGEFTPVVDFANSWHLSGEIDALRNAALQKASKISTLPTHQA